MNLTLIKRAETVVYFLNECGIECLMFITFSDWIPDFLCFCVLTAWFLEFKVTPFLKEYRAMSGLPGQTFTPGTAAVPSTQVEISVSCR